LWIGDSFPAGRFNDIKSIKQERRELLELFKANNDQILCDRGYDAEWIKQTNIFVPALKREKYEISLPPRSKLDNEILHETRSKKLVMIVDVSLSTFES